MGQRKRISDRYEIIKLNPISSFCITIRTFGSREEMECFNGLDEI